MWSYCSHVPPERGGKKKANAFQQDSVISEPLSLADVHNLMRTPPKLPLSTKWIILFFIITTNTAGVVCFKTTRFVCSGV